MKTRIPENPIKEGGVFEYVPALSVFDEQTSIILAIQAGINAGLVGPSKSEVSEFLRGDNPSVRLYYRGDSCYCWWKDQSTKEVFLNALQSLGEVLLFPHGPALAGKAVTLANGGEHA